MSDEIRLGTMAAARYLGIDPRTLRKLSDEGRLAFEATAVTKRRLYRVSDLAALKAEARTNA